MKSEARLGESAPSTSTPSTGVDRSSAGDPVDSCDTGVSCDTGAGWVVLMITNLGETTDKASYAARRTPGPARVVRIASRYER